MFTRIVELTVKPGKLNELTSIIQDKIIPTLRKQTGFVDEITLRPDMDTNKLLAISFWNTREDAERYHKTEYPRIQEMIQNLQDGHPVLKLYTVENSTAHKLAAGKAA